MKEYQRQHAVFEIAKKINQKKSLPAKRSELEELKKDPAVVKYLNLLDEIIKIEGMYKIYNTDEKIIEHVFSSLINEDYKCHHEIWLYDGSYYLSIDDCSEHNYLIEKFDENLPTVKGDFEFKYNRYICLECGKQVEIKDWENFEKNRFVLKNQNGDICIDDYISLYYQTLYNKSVKEAQETVKTAFEIEKAKSKTLKK